MSKLIGPFKQLLTMAGLATAGPIPDDALQIQEDAGILVEDGKILAIGPFEELRKQADEVEEIEEPTVALPGLIDCHTHICYGGNRAADFARRLQGMGYQEIAAAGGGILDTVRQTRAASEESLVASMRGRLRRLEALGVTTCEVKSGYGLSVDDELKMLRAITRAAEQERIDVIPTCLAAHTVPPEAESAEAYLSQMSKRLLPEVEAQGLAQRVDIFIEEGAFSVELARPYLCRAKELGFKLTIHADQFSLGGSALAAELGALSADHLEQSGDAELAELKAAGVIPVVLPGASIGLGMSFSPARRMLDAGLPVAIASDWNPGSAPMGNLLAQAAILAAAEKLSTAETLAGITLRAAAALDLPDRGKIASGLRADLSLFPTDDYRAILYHQGELRPQMSCIAGEIRRLAHGH